MKSKNNFLKFLGVLTLIFALALPINSYANRGSDDNSSADSDSNSSADSISSADNPKGGRDSVPLDGGLSILLLGAAAFGVKKLRDQKK